MTHREHEIQPRTETDDFSDDFYRNEDLEESHGTVPDIEQENVSCSAQPTPQIKQNYGVAGGLENRCTLEHDFERLRPKGARFFNPTWKEFKLTECTNKSKRVDLIVYRPPPPPVEVLYIQTRKRHVNVYGTKNTNKHLTDQREQHM